MSTSVLTTQRFGREKVVGIACLDISRNLGAILRKRNVVKKSVMNAL